MDNLENHSWLCNFLTIQNMVGYGGACLLSQHFEEEAEISVSLTSASPIKWVPEQPVLFHRKTLFQKTNQNKQKNAKIKETQNTIL